MIIKTVTQPLVGSLYHSFVSLLHCISYCNVRPLKIHSPSLLRYFSNTGISDWFLIDNQVDMRYEN